MNGAMDFLESLMKAGFDSWNTTYRMKQFSEHVPGFVNLTTDLQEEVVTNLDTEDLGGLYFLWTFRDKLLTEDITFTEFIEKYIFDPNATDTLLPQLIPTDAEFCEMYKNELNLIRSLEMLIPSTIILLILMFIKPRTNLWKGCLWGRPSLLVPVNYIDEHGRRWAFCGAFTAMTSFLLDFFDQRYFWNPGHWRDEQWALMFSWIRPFILLGNVIHLGYLFYPLFACISLRRHIPANILGLAYAAYWIYADIYDLQSCPIEPNRGETKLSFDKITRIVNYVVTFIGLLAVVIAFILDLAINCYKYYLKCTKQTKVRKSRWGGKETLPLQYIEYLLSARQEKPATLREKVKKMIVYTSVIGFKYPPRVICTLCAAFVLLLSLSINTGTAFDEMLIPLEQAAGVSSILESILGDVGNLSDPSIVKALEQTPRYVSGIRGCIIFGNVVASLMHFGSMLHMLKTYREHVRMVMRGDRSWHYDYDSSPSNKLVYGMRYSGYQIAYLLWGYIIMFFIVSIASIALTVVIIIPITFGEKPFFFNKIIIAISTVVGTKLIDIVQTTTAKFGFLQDYGAHLALTNRRAYHVMSYFTFFFNIVVGAFSVLRRSALSLIFGTLLLCRLDRCLLMRGFEHFDSGFSAYMGMLEVDATHNHPVLKGFIHILKTEVEDTEKRQQEKTNNCHDEKAVVLDGWVTHKIDKRIRNKWWKLITLVNNPALVIERLHRKVQEEREKKCDNRDDVVDMIATTGAVFIGNDASGATTAVKGIGVDNDAFTDNLKSMPL